MRDALVVGAGPAGSIAAIALSRAGARVALLDRATFPRHKLCGDTLNPGALALLRRLQLAADVEANGLRIDGMIVTGEGGVRVEGRYPEGIHGRSISRADLDWWLIQHAIAAGVEFLGGTPVRGLVVDHVHESRVCGVRISTSSGCEDVRAAVTIAADGRRSRLAFDLGLARYEAWPRRWAVGAYATGVRGMSRCGEMHVRAGRYVGIAPLPGGVTNVCLVRPSGPGDRTMRDPITALGEALEADPSLRVRFDAARFVDRAVVLGPLSVARVRDRAVPDGLLLAGDAAGFIDPMTGDGLRFAIQGGELAANAALEALEYGWTGVHARLGAERRRVFGAKWRFNRALRALVGAPIAVRAASLGSRLAPAVVRALILRAGDCDLVHRPVDVHEHAERFAPRVSNSRS
jgi:flavin-dependent dehydrogenase